MRKLLSAIFSLCATLAFAQPVQQTGNVTPGHVAMWTTTGIVQDAGSAANGFISSLGIQNNGGPGLCLNSAPITGPYNQLCLAVSTAANAQISLQNFGGAAAENLNIIINGTSYPFPGSLSGITINTTAVTGGSNGQCLFISSGTVGSQSCATNVVVGTTAIGSGTANGLLYDAAGVLGNLATGNNGVLVTSAGGAPSISTTLPSGLSIANLTISGALTYGGVTLASSVTGTGSMVLAANPQFTNNIGVGTAAIGAFQLNIAGTFDPTQNDDAGFQVASIGKFTTAAGSPYTNGWGQFIASGFDANGNTVTLTEGGGLRILNTTLLATGGGAVTLQNNELLRIDSPSGGSVTNRAIKIMGGVSETLGSWLINSTGIALTVGTGASSTSDYLEINGGASGNGSGAALEIAANGSAQSFVGTHSSITSGSYNANLLLYSAANAVEIAPNAVVAATFQASGGLSVGTTTDPGAGFMIASKGFTAGANGGTGGSLTLNGATSGAVSVTVPAGAGTTTFRLPNTNGTSGQLLQTDGSGNTSWITATGTGTVTALTAGAGLATGTAANITSTGTLYSIRSPSGRLTLVTGTPVMTANETAKTTLYYDCFNGNVVPYYDGTDDHSEAVAACEVSDAMVSAASAGQVVSGQIYDVWWVHGGANRICLAMSASTGGGGGWASDTGGSNTARGTGYSQLDTTTRPYITNKNSIANCFNGATNYGSVSANQATYLGTIYATANGQTGVAFSASGAGGGGNVVGIFNAYNRVPIVATSIDTTASWAYNSTTWRKADNNASNAIQWVDGLQVLTTECEYQVYAEAGSGTSAFTGCAIDWSSGGPTASAVFEVGTGVSSAWASIVAKAVSLPLVGLHTANAIEATSANQTFYGSGFGSASTQGQLLSLRLQM